MCSSAWSRAGPRLKSSSGCCPGASRQQARARSGRKTRCARLPAPPGAGAHLAPGDRKSTRLNSSHANISYAVFCLKKKNIQITRQRLGSYAVKWIKRVEDAKATDILYHGNDIT